MTSNKPRKSPISLILPILGQTITEDENYETEAYNITTKTTVRELKARLASYCEETGGTKEELIARLVKFAEDVPEWKRLFQPQTTKRKRGGGEPKSLSAKRRAVMFSDDQPQPSECPGKPDRPGTIPTTEFQIEQLDKWTDAVFNSYGIMSAASIRSSVRPPSIPADMPAAQDMGHDDCGGSHLETEVHPGQGQGEPPLLDDRDAMRMDMRRHMRRLETMLESKIELLTVTAAQSLQVIPLPAARACTSSPAGILPGWRTGPGRALPVPSLDGVPVPSPSAITSIQSLPLQTAGTTHQGVEASCPSTTLHVPSLLGMQPDLAVSHAGSDIMSPGLSGPSTCKSTSTEHLSNAHNPAENQITVVFGSERLTFDIDQIPDPPRRHFSRNISELFHEWDNGGLLKIGGHPIPLKYWPDLFQKRSSKRKGDPKAGDTWDAMKGEYGKWRYLVEEKERLGSEEAFWAAHSNERGQRLQYSKILHRLKICRERTQSEDAQAARQYFGGDLTRADTGGIFTYKKGPNTIILSKDKQIAEEWRDLLARNPAIAADWEMMRATRFSQPGIARPPPSTGHQ